MKVKKGTKLLVNHSRKGKFKGVATKDFDTEKDEWFSIAVIKGEEVHGLSSAWIEGEEVPCRKDLCIVTVIK